LFGTPVVWQVLRVSVEYHAHPERYVGTGTVFLAWNDDGGQDPSYVGYWDSMPDLIPSIPLEEAPNTRSLDEVVAWGRRRTPRVLIRPESDPGEYYWAGTGDPTGDDASLKRLEP
jgi:hypothetical protein